MRPKVATSGGRLRKASACVSQIINPKYTLIVAKVMMKLCTPVRTTITPLIAPSSAPPKSSKINAIGRLLPIPSSNQPPNMTAETPIEPTDKFSPPVTITTIIEKPITTSMEMLRPSAYKLKREVKPVVSSAKIVANTTIRNSKPNSLEKKNFLIED